MSQTNFRKYGTKAVPKLLDKVNIADIVDDLTGGGTGVPLSAQQGIVLKQSVLTETTNRQQAILNVRGGASATHDTLKKIEDLLDAETAARIAGESGSSAATLQAIEDLRDDLEAADTTLQTNITTGDATLQTALNSEIARATAAEQTLTDDLAQEVVDRQTAVTNEATARSNAVTAEATARSASDSTLQSNINAEETARIAGDNSLQNNIDSETSRAQGAETVLQSNIDNEKTQRQNTDGQHENRISAIESGLVAGIRWKAVLADMSELDALVEGDVEAGWGYYVGADKDVYVVIDTGDGDHQPANWNTKSFLKFADFAEVTGMINAEKTRAQAAESALSGDIAAEATRATTAEGTLQTNLTAEVTRATAAEQGITTSLATKEAQLQSNIDAENTRATGEEARIEGLVTQEVIDRQSAVTQEKNRAEGEETRIEGLVTTEISDRIAAVLVEKNRALAAESGLQTSITTLTTNLNAAILAEETARITADNGIKSRLDVIEGSAETSGSILNAVATVNQNIVDAVLKPKLEGMGGTLLVVGDTVTVSNSIENGVNGVTFGEVIVYAGDNDSEAIAVNVASVAGSVITLAVGTASEFDGKQCKVHYFYRDIEQGGAGQGLAGLGGAGA